MILYLKKIKIIFNGILFLYFLTSISYAQGFPNETISSVVDKSKQAQILVFASSSMPTASLQQWFAQAQLMGAVIVLRGFFHQSLQETRTWLKLFLSQQKDQPFGIEINPVAFEAYGIKQVPAVLVTEKVVQCVSNDDCQIPAFDVIYGNMALAQALKIISEKGELGSRSTLNIIQLAKEKTHD